MILVRDAMNDMINGLLSSAAWFNATDSAAPSVAMIPVSAPFVPSPDLLLSDLTFPPTTFFDHDAIITPTVGSSTMYLNALLLPGIKILEPIGGFTWVVVDDSLGPITVEGFAMVKTTAGVPSGLICAGVLPVPLTFNLNGQVLQASSLTGTLQAVPFTQDAKAISPAP